MKIDECDEKSNLCVEHMQQNSMCVVVTPGGRSEPATHRKITRSPAGKTQQRNNEY